MQGFKIKYFKVNSHKGEFITEKRGIYVWKSLRDCLKTLSVKGAFSNLPKQEK